VTDKGGRMVLDPEPRDDGNIVVQASVGRDPLVRVLKKGEVERLNARQGSLLDPEAPPLPDRWGSHWATCPNAEQARADAAAKRTASPRR
jgi:hypothetical protein